MKTGRSWLSLCKSWYYCEIIHRETEWQKEKKKRRKTWYCHTSEDESSSETQGLLAGTMRYFRASDIFGREFTLSAEESLGTYSYRTSSRSGQIPFRWLGRKIFFCQSARSSSRVTLSPSYTKQFSSSIDILAWPIQRNGKVVVKNFRKKYSTKPRKSQALKYCFCLRGKLVEYPRLLLISPRSLSNFWNFARYANRRCTGHATMSTQRGNDRLITVHAPFLVLAIAPWRNNDNHRIGRELIALSLKST